MGKFISIITFPGTIIHEFSHEFFCRLFGMKVKKVCYFRFGNPAGFVIHEQARHFYQAFFVSMGPFILGNALAVFAFRVGRQQQDFAREAAWLWIGASIALNSFPSSGDAKSLWLENWQQIRESIFAILGLPFTALVWIVSKFNLLIFRLIFAGALFYCSLLFS